MEITPAASYNESWDARDITPLSCPYKLGDSVIRLTVCCSNGLGEFLHSQFSVEKTMDSTK